VIERLVHRNATSRWLDWLRVADKRSDVIFSGFDSAWGARKSGAICNLLLNADGSLVLTGRPGCRKLG
jgi:hypothetical protein